MMRRRGKEKERSGEAMLFPRIPELRHTVPKLLVGDNKQSIPGGWK
jgi:hypothetical protein